MSADRLPELWGQQHPSQRRAEPGRGELAVRPSPQPPAPLPAIHTPTGFPMDEGQPGGEACWPLLGERVRAKLLEKAGTVITQWAYLNAEGHPEAVVFGELGLCVARSIEREGGRRAHVVERIKLEPGAMRRQTFSTTSAAGAAAAAQPRRPGASLLSRVRRSTPARAAVDAGAAAPGPEQAGAPAAARVSLPLQAEATGMLGNFPADVQEYLQRPFVPDDRRVVARWHYDEYLELTHARLEISFLLSADRSVTCAVGTRYLPRGRDASRATWELTCYHAPVLGQRA